MADKTEYDRWLAQSTDTLKAARDDFLAQNHNWACFKAQQAAEYAVKGLLWGLGLSAFGHSILKLLTELKEEAQIAVEPVAHCARVLDRHYIAPRYPDAYPEGSPHEYYDAQTTEEALAVAEELLSFVESEWKKLV